MRINTVEKCVNLFEPLETFYYFSQVKSRSHIYKSVLIKRRLIFPSINGPNCLTRE